MSQYQCLVSSLLLAITASPVWASVKTGIDAYQRGDFAIAVNTWRPLAIAGDADAQYNMGQAYRLGRGVPVDPQMAESWFQKAADQGHERARNAYGLTLFQNGRRAEAIPHIEESAGRGYPQSQYVFATLLFNGDLVGKDWVRSYALMTRAAASDVAAAKAGLSQLDRFIPLDQRQRGLKLAEAMANANPQTDMIKNVDLPPSTIKPVEQPIVAAAKPRVAKTPAISASPEPDVGGAWRVQLGAFRNGAAASALWNSLRTRVAALARYQSFSVPAGPNTRLQAGPLPSRTAAETLCTAVKAAGNACLIVAP